MRDRPVDLADLVEFARTAPIPRESGQRVDFLGKGPELRPWHNPAAVEQAVSFHTATATVCDAGVVWQFTGPVLLCLDQAPVDQVRVMREALEKLADDRIPASLDFASWVRHVATVALDAAKWAQGREYDMQVQRDAWRLVDLDNAHPDSLQVRWIQDQFRKRMDGTWGRPGGRQA